MQTRNHILQIHTSEVVQRIVTDSPRSLTNIESPAGTEEVPHFEESEDVSVHVSGEPGPSSPQHSPPLFQTVSAASPGASSTTSSTAPTVSAPQRARERIAKFTATLIGAAGSIGTYGSSANDETSSCDGLTLREVEDQFMGLKIREADTLAELKEMRQRVMELETQVNIVKLIILFKTFKI